jgi:hypothetical protein
MSVAVLFVSYIAQKKCQPFVAAATLSSELKVVWQAGSGLCALLQLACKCLMSCGGGGVKGGRECVCIALQQAGLERHAVPLALLVVFIMTLMYIPDVWR